MIMASVIDFHTHILPGIDDGSKSVDESLALLRLEAEQGIRQVVMTPHFYTARESLSHFLEKRAQALERLNTAIKGIDNLPQLAVGAEVRIFDGISQSEFLSELAISGTNCILIEMPMPPWSDSLLQELAQIQYQRDLIPIVAHIDRYISPFRTKGIPEALAKLPVLVQASGSFFTNRSTKSLALKLLREDKIHLLGSDCHNLSSRPPNLREALSVIENKFGKNAILHINSIESGIFAVAK